MLTTAQQIYIKRQLAAEKNNVSKVAKITGHTRNTIAKYRDLPLQEKGKSRKRQSLLEKEGFAALLKGWVCEDTSLPSDSRKTCSVKVMHENLVSLGFSGSYETVARYVRKLKEERSAPL